MDSRVSSLTPWQRGVYDLCWQLATVDKHDKEKIARLNAEANRLKSERPKEYAEAFEVWKEVMYDTLY